MNALQGTGLAAGSPRTRTHAVRAAQRGVADLHILILLGVIFLLPVAVSTWFLLQQQREEIALAERELVGAQYAGALRALEHSSGRYRAAARAGTAAKLAAEVNGRVSAVEALETRHSALLHSAAGWGRVKAAWARIEAGAEKMDARDGYRALDAALTVHLADVVARSHLLLDPQIEANSLARLMTVEVPALAAASAQVRDAVDMQAPSEIGQQLLQRSAAIRLAFDTLFEASAAVRTALHSPAAAALNSALELNALLRASTPAAVADAQAAANRALTAIETLSLALAVEHRKVIEARLQVLKDFQWHMLGLIAMCVSGALLGFILLGRVWLTTTRAREVAARRDADENQRNQAALLRLMNEMDVLIAGDLSAKATVSEDITGAIADSVNLTVGELRNLVAGVNATADQVTTGAADASVVSQRLLSSASHQGEELRKAGDTVERMTQSIGEVSKSAAHAAAVARLSLVTAARGSQALQNSLKAMHQMHARMQETSQRIQRVGASSQEIGEIAERIADMSEQANLLALNAAIQAATAGAAGRGFAVVAEEVQRLGERASVATQHIGAIVKAIQAEAQDAVAAMEKITQGAVEGVQLSDSAGGALSEIDTVTQELAGLMQNIALSSERQVDSAREVANSMHNALTLSSEATQGTHETTATMQQLALRACQLKASVARFKA